MYAHGLRWCRAALAQTLSSTAAVINPPSRPTCSQLARLCGTPLKRGHWLIIVGDSGLATAAVLLGVLASAKRHGLNAWDYLRRPV